MKHTALALTLSILCALAPAFAADSAEQSRAANDLSFDRILNQLTDEYYRGLQMPATPVPAEARTARDDRFWITVYAANPAERTRLLEAGMDIVEIKGNSVSGTMRAELLPALSAKGILLASKIPLSEYLAFYTKDFPAADAAYHNFQETTDLLKALAAKHPDVASLMSIGKTVEGRDIWCLRVNSTAKGAAPSSKPGALYVGTHHAREHLANEVPLLFAVWLLDNRATAEVRKYIETLDIYVIPMLNPDGAEFDIRTGSYKWHRKNMRVNSDKSIGVDLNRNYDSWWCTAGASGYPGSDTYCGLSAFSEPESLAIKRFVEARKNLKTLNSYHSYASTILYPYGGSYDEVPDANDRKIFVNMAKQMGLLTGYRPEKSSDMYVATGDTCDWAYDVGRIYAFTTELEGNGFYPGAGIIDRAVKGNIKAAVYMLSVTDNPHKVI